MKFLKSVPINDTTLISSSVPETEAAWSVGTTYALDAVVRKNHKVYAAAQAANTGHDPEMDDGTWWIYVGPTNRYAMFDNSVGSATMGTDPITIVITPDESFNAIGFQNLVAESVQVSVVVDSTTIYDKTIDMEDRRALTGWWDFFFMPLDRTSTFTIEDLPPFGTITTVINGTSCGAMLIGRMFYVGKTSDKPDLGVLDYTVKETNDYGVTSVTPRPTATRIDAKFMVDENRVDAVFNTLSNMSAEFVFWIVDESGRFSSLTTLGLRGDFSITPTRTEGGICQGRLVIQGVI